MIENNVTPHRDSSPVSNDSTPPIIQKIVNLPRGTLDLSYQSNSKYHYDMDDLLGFAQRINPKRAFLFVSKVLGRHIPVAPSVMRDAFSHLADAIPDNLPEPIVVVGMAETAVGLSAGVHQALQTRYPDALLLNSTRHAQTDATQFTTFSEDHSHASTHLIYLSDDPEIQAKINNSKTLVMVDDEASTGNTCVNVVSALREAGLKDLEQVHLATLVDWSIGQKMREQQQSNAPDNAESSLIDTSSDAKDAIDTGMSGRLPGVDFTRHHLLCGDWTWTDAANPEPINMPSVDTTDAGSQPILPTGNWGRLPTLDSTEGFPAFLERFQQVYTNTILEGDRQGNWEGKWQKIPLPKRTLVLGSNEFVWLPFLLAEWLEIQAKRNTANDKTVKFSALTRSPIALGGAIESVLSFNDNYGLGMTNFAYNVTPDDWDLIVLCVETPTDSVDKLWQDLDNVIIVSPL